MRLEKFGSNGKWIYRASCGCWSSDLYFSKREARLQAEHHESWCWECRKTTIDINRQKGNK